MSVLGFLLSADELLSVLLGPRLPLAQILADTTVMLILTLLQHHHLISARPFGGCLTGLGMLERTRNL